MGRYQTGYVYEAYGAFHVRYYTTELVDGQSKRVQRSQRLGTKDNKHHSAKCKAVQQLAAQVMQKVNAMSGAAQEQDVLVAAFWEQTYLPHLQKTKKASTLNGYLKLWSKHLAPAFAGVRLGEFTCPRATLMLTSLVEDKHLGRRSLAHVRSLASGMFRHAKQLGLIEENPFADAESHIKPPSPEETHAYSLKEAEAIVNALIDHPQEQLVFCLATFLGLRPGEISGLKWLDVDNDWIHIRRAAWRGVIGETKTPESVASVPLIEPIRSMFAAWRTQCMDSPEGWCFPNRIGDPMEMNGLCRRLIVPILKAKGIAWHGLYAGRRAAGTLLTQLTGDALAAQYVLRHSNLSTMTAFYIKPSREEAVNGMRLVEERLSGMLKLTLVKPKALAAANDSGE